MHHFLIEQFILFYNRGTLCYFRPWTEETTEGTTASTTSVSVGSSRSGMGRVGSGDSGPLLSSHQPPPPPIHRYIEGPLIQRSWLDLKQNYPLLFQISIMGRSTLSYCQRGSGCSDRRRPLRWDGLQE